jgi:hypothetical protein
MIPAISEKKGLDISGTNNPTVFVPFPMSAEAMMFG